MDNLRQAMMPLHSDQASGLIQVLYRNIHRGPEVEFRSWSLARLRELLPFDAAVWTGGDVCPCRWGAVSADGDRLSLWRRDGFTGREDGIELIRKQGEPPFSDRARHLMEFLFPHLIESAAHHLILCLNGGGIRQPEADAICDGQGRLLQANEAFKAFMLLEFPQWLGPGLPWNLENRRGESFFVRGDHIIVQAVRRETLIHLQARRRALIDRLSEAELRVALKLRDGADYKVAARELGLSPSTVNNHAVNLFRKLGVKSKSELAMRWTELALALA